MPSARMSDILQQDDKMRMLGWSMMSTCPDGQTDGPMDRQVDRRGHSCPRVEAGVVGRTDGFKSWLDGR